MDTGIDGEITSQWPVLPAEALSFSNLVEAHTKQLASLQRELSATHAQAVHLLELQIQRLVKQSKELQSQNCKRERKEISKKEDKWVERVENWASSQTQDQVEIIDQSHVSLPSSKLSGTRGTEPILVAPARSELPTAWSSVVCAEQRPGHSCPPKEADCSMLSVMHVQSCTNDEQITPFGNDLLPGIFGSTEDTALAEEAPIPSKQPTGDQRASVEILSGHLHLPNGEAVESMPGVSHSHQGSPLDETSNFSGSACQSKDVTSITSDDGDAKLPFGRTRSKMSVTFNSIGPNYISQESDDCKKSDSDDSTSSESSKDNNEGGAGGQAKSTDKLSQLNSDPHENPWLLAPVWLLHERRKGIFTRSGTGLASLSSNQISQWSKVPSVDNTTSSHAIFSLVDPSSKLAHAWELFGLAFLVYDLVAVPLDVLQPEETWFTVGASWTICIYWTLSIGISFCQGYINEDGFVVYKPMSIIKRYAATWLLPDVIALAFSWADLILNNQRTGTSNLWVSEFRMVRLLRLVRAPAVVGLTFERVQSDRGVLLIGVFKIVTMIISFAHFIACFWYGVGCLDTTDGQGWVYRASVQTRPFPQRYIHSFYWAIAAFVGEVTNNASTNVEQGYTAGVILFSFLISTSFVSSLTTSMTDLHIVSSQHSHNMSALRYYLAEHQVSGDLVIKLIRNAQHAVDQSKRRTHEDSIELLNSVSDPLLAELHFELRGRHLFVHPFIKNYSHVNSSGLKKVCHRACQYFIFHSGDTVFHEFEVPTAPRMFFVTEGALMYRQECKRSQIELEPGQWASEAALWLATWTYLGTMTSNCESQVLLLDAQRFQKVVHTYPTSHLKVYAKFLVDHIKKQHDLSELTDLCEDRYELETIVDDAFTTAEDEEMLADFNEKWNNRRDSRSHMRNSAESRPRDSRMSGRTSFLANPGRHTSSEKRFSTNTIGTIGRASFKSVSAMNSIKQWL